MRPTFVHVLTGLLLGTALAGLLNVPGRVVAHQESIPPVRAPHPAKPAKDVVVRLSPTVERALAAERAEKTKPKPRAAPPVRYRRVVVRASEPQPPPAVATPSPPPKAEEPAPEPTPPSPPPSPPPEPPRVVVGGPEPPSADDEDGPHEKHPKKAKKAKKPKKPKKEKAETTDEAEDAEEDEQKHGKEKGSPHPPGRSAHLPGPKKPS